MNKTILLVEDDKLLGATLKDTFEKAGYITLWAQDSIETYQILTEAKPDLIFLDKILPGEEDGYSILRHLKSSPDFRSVPTIMLTNMGQSSEVDQAMEIGATDYIVKANVDLEKLVELAKKYLA